MCVYVCVYVRMYVQHVNVYVCVMCINMIFFVCMCSVCVCMYV